MNLFEETALKPKTRLRSGGAPDMIMAGEVIRVELYFSGGAVDCLTAEQAADGG